MKKCVHTLVINNYFPEMCKITIPLMRAWADKIGADFNIIRERKFPDFTINYEKMQIWEKGKGYDWNVYLDADMIIDPKEMPDFTEQDPRFFYYEAHLLDLEACFNAHPYFLRDERRFGVSDCFLVSSAFTHDLWHPMYMNFEEAKKYCRLTERMVSEFALSLNIARFGLKGLGSIGPDKNHFHLQTTDNFDRTWNGGKEAMTREEHVERALEKVKEMNIDLSYYQGKFKYSHE